jgi:hypothetical protein
MNSATSWLVVPSTCTSTGPGRRHRPHRLPRRGRHDPRRHAGHRRSTRRVRGRRARGRRTAPPTARPHPPTSPHSSAHSTRSCQPGTPRNRPGPIVLNSANPGGSGRDNVLFNNRSRRCGELVSSVERDCYTTDALMRPDPASDCTLPFQLWRGDSYPARSKREHARCPCWDGAEPRRGTQRGGGVVPLQEWRCVPCAVSS